MSKTSCGHSKNAHQCQACSTGISPRPPKGKHSLLPWSYDLEDEAILDAKSNFVGTWHDKYKYAEFICRAVNLHAKLLAALEACVQWMEPVMDGLDVPKDAVSRGNLEVAKTLLKEAKASDFSDGEK